MAIVYKIMTAAEWRTALAAGSYGGSADDRRDSFIHLSTGPQVPGTLARHFADARDLVLAAFDGARLGAALRYEASRGGALFPHLYGPLDPAASLRTRNLKQGADGRPVAPENLA
jgi:uncharacterized protein (DUF952 family)